MSSLASQLSNIAQANQAVALDRKKRSKLHSVSLIHEAHYAATQDYETIYEDAIEALDRLEGLDSRFGKFKFTIFSPTSIRIDRQVQSKEENEDLDKTIDTFIALLAPYWDLAIAARAAEWPLRRFQMNIHNAEQLLLTTLPYFHRPAFPRILYVVTKLPTLFTWLNNFKKNNKAPSKNTMVKAFTDVDIFNLYTKFLQEQLQHKNQYRRQLVFYVSMTVSALAILSASGSDKLASYIGHSLESISFFLTSNDEEAKVSAYTILSVISAAVPLSKHVVVASIETVLLSASGKGNKLSPRAFTCILQLLGSIQSGALESLPSKVYSMLPSGVFDVKYPYLNIIKSSRTNSKFLTAYLRTLIINKKEISLELLKIIDDLGIQFSEFQISVILSDIVKIVMNNSADDVTIYVNLLKYLASSNKDIFLTTLEDGNVKLTDLEMIVSHTLIPNVDIQVDDEIIEVSNDDHNIADDKLQQLFVDNKTTIESFLVASDNINEAYSVLESLFFKSIHTRSTGEFFTSVFNNETSVILSFLTRVATSMAPIAARLRSIHLLGEMLKSLNDNTYAGLLYPSIICLFQDESSQIRKQVSKLFEIISLSSVKDAPTKVLLRNKIYGDDVSDDLVILSPKDNAILIKAINDSSSQLIVDNTYLVSSFKPLLADKKVGKLILAYFTSHALHATLPAIKMTLISISSNCADFVKSTAAPSQLFSEFLESYIKNIESWNKICKATSCDFQKFQSNILSLIRPKEKNEAGLKFLQASLSVPYPSLVELAQQKIIQIFTTLKFETQVQFANNMLDEGLNNPDVLYDPIEILEAIDFTGELFVELFKGCSLNTTEAQAHGQTPKRRRRSSQTTKHAMKEDEVSTMASDHLKKVTMLLDVLDTFSKKDRFRPSLELLRLLFGILDDLESLGKDGKLPILYAQETLASCLKNVIHRIKELNIPLNDFSVIRADVVVSAIRSSDSPQVQNKLLLAISALASLCPELILHSVMPIFTFMGAHTIRQDDEFSGHVVEQTIICVIPALANAAQNGMIDEIEFLLASFVSAFLHIPRHRRVKLFTTLARTLGEDLSVHLILFLCGQQYVEAYMKHKMGDCSALVDFAAVFLQNFKAQDELKVTMKFLDLWKILPEEPLDKDSPKFKELCSRVIFGPTIMSMTKIELYSLRKGLASFIRHALTDAKGSNGISKLRLKIASQILQGTETTELLGQFSDLTKYLLEVINVSNKQSEDDEIINKFYKLLGDVLSLLPIQYYVKSVGSILNDDNTSLQTLKSVIVLTSSKFNMEHIENIYAHDGINTLVPILLEKVSNSKDVELSQACLDTMASIFKKFNDYVDSAMMIKCLSVISGKVGLMNEESPELAISSIYCITSVVSNVGVKMIGLFPKIMGPSLKIFNDCVEKEQESAKLIQISILVLYSTLIKKIPNFLTPNIKDILKSIFRAQQVSDTIRMNIMETVIEYIDSKIVLSSLCGLWDYIATLEATSVGLYLTSLEQVIEKMTKKVAVSESGSFFKFITRALEYRAISKFDINAIGRVEAGIHNCGISYVMKLNDKTFRPLFAAVVRWAFDGEGVVNDISYNDRIESFFKFFNRMQENLRGIITSYFSYIVDSTESILKKYIDGEMTDVSIRRTILISLSSSFKYDQTEFWQVDSRFKPISEALTGQFINIDDSIGKHLVKALTYLAQTTSSSDEHNKQLNELLMKHMRAECNPKEKFWAVRSMKNIYKKVGESWLSLLPQMVPLIAELLEDDDEQVEMEVRTGLAKVLEEVMGEPLDRYLE